MFTQGIGFARFVGGALLRVGRELQLSRGGALAVKACPPLIEFGAELLLQAPHLVGRGLRVGQRGLRCVLPHRARQRHGQAQPGDLFGAATVARAVNTDRGVGQAIQPCALGPQLQTLGFDAQQIELVVLF